MPHDWRAAGQSFKHLANDGLWQGGFLMSYFERRQVLIRRPASVALLVGVALAAGVLAQPCSAQDGVALTLTTWLASAQVQGMPLVAVQPLSFEELMAAVENSHPAVQTARVQARAAEQDVETVDRQRWPSVSVVLESAAGGAGLAVPSRLFRVEQTMWDFGRLKSLRAESREQVNIAQTNVAISRQELLLQALNTWQQLVSGVERERVARKALGLLVDYRSQMQRRVEANASAAIDLALAEARVLQAQADLALARSVVLQATGRLEQLSGLPHLGLRVREIQLAPLMRPVEAMAQQLRQLDLTVVASESPTVQRAAYEYSVLEKRLEVKAAEQNPQVYFRLDKPLDSASGSGSTSLRYYVGLRYSPSAGGAGYAEVKALSTRLEGQGLAADTALREVLQALSTDREEFISARNRLDGLERSAAGAKDVLASYQRQFEAARKSWLDLLNSVREVSAGEYALAEARVAMLGAMWRLQLRMGQPLGAQ